MFILSLQQLKVLLLTKVTVFESLNYEKLEQKNTINDYRELGTERISDTVESMTGEVFNLITDNQSYALYSLNIAPLALLAPQALF